MVSPGTLPSEQAMKGALSPFFLLYWLLWFLEPMCLSGESVLSMRLCFGAQHSLATGNGAQLLISKEKNLKLRPGRVILGFWWFGFFFFSPHLAT